MAVNSITFSPKLSVIIPTQTFSLLVNLVYYFKIIFASYSSWDKMKSFLIYKQTALIIFRIFLHTQQFLVSNLCIFEHQSYGKFLHFISHPSELIQRRKRFKKKTANQIGLLFFGGAMFYLFYTRKNPIISLPTILEYQEFQLMLGM